MTAVHKFLVPFANTGDKADIPVLIQSDGSVSFPEGWGFDYSRNPSTDPLAKRIDRATFNQLMYAITSALGQLQTQGAPEWITAAENGGSAYPYAARAMVRYGSAVYQSLVDNNAATPGTDATKWTVFDASPMPDATTTVKGKVELSTVAEAVAGLLSNVAVTPDGLAAALAAAIPSLAAYARLDTAQTFTAPQTPGAQVLADAATVTIAITKQVWTLTTAAARTIGAPTGAVANTFYALEITTGGFTPSWNAVFDFGSNGVPTGLTGTVMFVFFYDGTKFRAVGQFLGGA